MQAPDELFELIEEYLGGLELAPELGSQRDSMRYALEGGKRIRAVICLATAQAAGAEPGDALPAAAALELVHAFSLVHDDLPALDDDDERRGRASAHVAFGEGVALLAGDALLSEAFRLVLTYPTPEPARELVDATLGMIGGQYLDITGADADLAELHRLKTGRLFAASVGLGLCGGRGAGRGAGLPGARSARSSASCSRSSTTSSTATDTRRGWASTLLATSPARRQSAPIVPSADPGRHGGARLDRRRARRPHRVDGSTDRKVSRTLCGAARSRPREAPQTGMCSTAQPAASALEKNAGACRRPGSAISAAPSGATVAARSASSGLALRSS